MAPPVAAVVPALMTAGGRHGITLGIGVTAAALIVTYGGFTAFDYATDRPGTFPLPQAMPEPEENATNEPEGGVAVPDVVRMPFAEAEATLRSAGFSVTRNDVESDEPLDTVVEQDPAAPKRLCNREHRFLCRCPWDPPRWRCPT